MNELIDNYQYEEAEVLFKKLESIMKIRELAERYPRNQQFLIRTNAVLKRVLYGQSEKMQIKELEYALQLTMPDYYKRDFSKKLLLSQEAFILNSIAVIYFEEGDFEKGVEIWEAIKKSYQTSKLYGITSYSGYDKMQTNYASCIGSMGKYDQSSEIAQQTMKLFLEKGTMKYLARLCYEIAWNMEEKMKLKYGKVRKESAYQKKLRYAEVIARMTNNVVLEEFFRKHRKAMYQINE